MDAKTDNRDQPQVHKVDAWIAQAVVQCFEECKTECQPYHDKIQEARDQYTGGDKAPRRQSYSGLADLYPNITAEACDGLWGVSMGALFPNGSTDFFEPAGEDRQSILRAPVVKKAMQHFLRICDFMPEASLWIRDSIIDGTAVMKIGWDYRVARVEQPTRRKARERTKISEGVTEEPEPEFRKKWAVVADKPYLENSDVLDFFIPNAKAKDIDDLDYAGIRFSVTRRDLQVGEMQEVPDPRTKKSVLTGRYRNVDQVPKSAQAASAKETRIPLPFTEDVSCLQFFFRDLEGLFAEASDELDWKGRLTDHWGFDDEDLEGGAAVTVAADMVPIAIDPMQDAQARLSSVFVINRWLPEKDCFFGQPVPQLIRSEQIELAALRNQGLDVVTAMLNKRWLVSSFVTIDEGELRRRRPNQLITVDNPMAVPLSEAIREDVPSGIPGEFWSSEAAVRRDAERRTGAADIVLGMPAQSGTTATEVTARSQGAYARFEAIARLMEWKAVTPLLASLYALIRRDVAPSFMIRVMGERGIWFTKLVRKEQLWGAYRWIPTGVREMTSRFIRSQQMLQLLQNPIAAPYLNMPMALRKFVSALGDPDADQMVTDTDTPYRMMAIEDQWTVFLQGQEVSVSGRESDEEHQEAIAANALFMREVLPALERETGELELVEDIKRLVAQNIKDHEWHQKQKAAMMQQAAMMSAMTPSRRTPAALPESPEAMMAGMNQRPGMVPNAEGMR